MISINKTILFSSLIFLCAGFTISAQTGITKSIKEFGAKGDGRSNDHEAFLKASKYFNDRGGNGKLVIPKGLYIVGRQGMLPDGTKDNNVLDFVNCKNLIVEGQSAVIRFADNLKFGAFDPATGEAYHSSAQVFADYKYSMPIGNFIQLVRCRNIIIKNIEVDGNQKKFILGGKYGDVGFQLTHDGIFIRNSSAITLDNLFIHHMGRDGVQLLNETPQGWDTPDQQVKVSNCRFEYNGRQGFSWVGGSGLQVKNCKFNFTGRDRIQSPPGAGLDIEGEVGIIRNGNFQNCEFIDNMGSGVVADGGDSRGMTFTNCTFWGTTNWTVWTTKPKYTFNGCTFHGSIVHGYNSPDDENATKYYKCVFEDKDYKGKASYGGYLVEMNNIKRARFTECKFIANQKKMLWIVNDAQEFKTEELTLIDKCKLILKNKAIKYPDFWAKYYNVRFKDDEWFIPIDSKNSDTYFVAGGKNVLSGTSTWHYTDKDKKIVQ